MFKHSGSRNWIPIMNILWNILHNEIIYEYILYRGRGVWNILKFHYDLNLN